MERAHLILVLVLCACGGPERSKPDPVTSKASDNGALPANQAPDVTGGEPENEPEVADAGFIGGLPPDLVVGVAECDRLIAVYWGCDKLPQQARDAFAQAALAWKQSLASGGDAARSALAEACRQAHDGARSALDSLGCGDGQGAAPDAGP